VPRLTRGRSALPASAIVWRPCPWAVTACRQEERSSGDRANDDASRFGAFTAAVHDAGPAILKIGIIMFNLVPWGVPLIVG